MRECAIRTAASTLDVFAFVTKDGKSLFLGSPAQVGRLVVKLQRTAA